MKLNLIHESGCRKMNADIHAYIMDVKQINHLNYGYHRLHHVLSLCVQQDIDIYEGDLSSSLQQLINTHKITHIIIQASDDLEFVSMVNAFSNQVHIEWIESEYETFIQMKPQSSFFSFFKKIEPHLKNQGLSHE
jgi:hypothetical protein